MNSYCMIIFSHSWAYNQTCLQQNNVGAGRKQVVKQVGCKYLQSLFESYQLFVFPSLTVALNIYPANWETAASEQVICFSVLI